MSAFTAQAFNLWLLVAGIVGILLFGFTAKLVHYYKMLEADGELSSINKAIVVPSERSGCEYKSDDKTIIQFI